MNVVFGNVNEYSSLSIIPYIVFEALETDLSLILNILWGPQNLLSNLITMSLHLKILSGTRMDLYNLILIDEHSV